MNNTSENQKAYQVQTQDEGLRLDIFLSEQTGQTRSQISNLIRDGHVSMKGKKVKAGNLVKENEQYLVSSVEEETLVLIPQNIDLSILYQDQDIAIVEKPRHMAVHPSEGCEEQTLVHALLYHLDTLSDEGEDYRPGIVHRLDKDTTGLLVVAKNNMAHQNLLQQFQNKQIKRKYVALVHGNIKEDKGSIHASLARNPKNRLRMAVVEGGRNALTHYTVLERLHEATLVELELETGRTHQIRVHLQHTGNPIFYDPIYGIKKERDSGKGQMLHAKQLGLYHPTTQLWMEWEAAPPADFQTLYQRLKDESKI